LIAEVFAGGDSVIQRLDPRVRITAAICYSIIVALLSGFFPMLIALIFSFILAFLSSLGFRALLHRALIFNAVIMLFWLVVPFTFRGEVLFQLGPLTATGEGVLYALAITVKSNAIFLSFLALVATMSAAATGYAMQRLGFPVKFVTLLLLTYRYVFVIEQEYNRLMRALRARGFIAKNDIHTYRTYAYLVGMLFVRAWDRAERVNRAMRCRGFEGRFYCLTEYSLSWRDLIFSGATALALCSVGAAEWMPLIY
jgi:cobalt/nickel transport system permease protein